MQCWDFEFRDGLMREINYRGKNLEKDVHRDVIFLSFSFPSINPSAMCWIQEL